MKASRSVIGLLAAAIVYLGAVSAGAAGQSQVRFDAQLGSGRLGGYNWATSTFREGHLPPSASGRRRPCLEVSLSGSHGLFHSISGCYGPGYLKPKSEPLLAAVEESGITVVGAAFAPAARTLVADFADGSQETIRLRRLNPRQARKVAKERFRYAAFAVKGSWCPERLTSLNAAGQPLWEVEEHGNCPLGSGAVYWVEAIT